MGGTYLLGGGHRGERRRLLRHGASGADRREQRARGVHRVLRRARHRHEARGHAIAVTAAVAHRLLLRGVRRRGLLRVARLLGLQLRGMRRRLIRLLRVHRVLGADNAVARTGPPKLARGSPEPSGRRV